MARWHFEQVVDLAKPEGPRTWPDLMMVEGDQDAHQWRVEVLDGGQAASLAGYSVTAYFDRCDGVTIPVVGTISDHSAIVSLPQAAYLAPGPMICTMRARSSGQTITLAAGRCIVRKGPGDAYGDPDAVLPNADDIMARLEALERNGGGGGSPTVYCWGDSLTEGVGGWLATPEGVQKTIVSAYPDMVARSYPCVNLGCRGETIQTIMARQGADPMVVGGFTIHASAAEDVVVGYLRGGYFDDNRLGLSTASGDLAQPLKEAEAGINPCVIAGVEGTLYRDNSADSSGRYAYRFRRLTDGTAVDVDAGTQIETYAMRNYRNGVAVIWMGANGAVSSHNAYIDKIKQMVAYGNYSNYLVLIAREYTSQWVLDDTNSIAKALTDTDGICHLLYLPPELLRRGYTLAGIAASAGVPDTSGWSTTDEIKRNAPLLMCSSGGAAEGNFETLHFSAYGYKAIGKLVVERLGQMIGVQNGSGNTGGNTGGGNNGGGSGSTDKGYVTDGTDDFGEYAYKLTRSMTGVGNAVNTGVKLYEAEKDWTIAIRFADSMTVTDGSLGSVFELRKYFDTDSKQTAVFLRLMPQTDGSMAYNFAGGFGGFNFPFDNCPGYVEPTDGYHTAAIAKNGGNYEFYLDGGLAYNSALGYAIAEDHYTDEPVYLFGRVEDGNTHNTVTGVIADFRIYNAYMNKTAIANLIADMGK